MLPGFVTGLPICPDMVSAGRTLPRDSRYAVIQVALYEYTLKLLKEHQHLQLEHAGKLWSFLREPSRGRVGCACCSATVWAFRRLEAGAFVGSVRAWEQHVCT